MNKIYNESCLDTLNRIPDNYLDCVVTSPPYWGLRDYGVDGQLGLEKTPEEYVEKLVGIFHEIKRALKPIGTVWLNLGDSYWNNFGGGSPSCTTGNKKALEIRGGANKPKSDKYKIKDLIGVPWKVAFALQADGWWLRSDIIWHKPNPMPESVTDRPTKSHEYIFLLSRSAKYYYDQEAIMEDSDYNENFYREKLRASKTYNLKEPYKNNFPISTKITGKKNKRSVWTVTTKSFKEAHFATYPPDLIRPCILAGCPKGGIVYDPFMGSGTTAEVAILNNRKYIGSELNPDYLKLAEKRLGLFK